MIAFDLECSRGHVFEGWFDSLESFEQQNDMEMVSCPYCNDTSIRKIISPVALKKSDPEDRAPVPAIDYQRLAKEVVEYIDKNFEDVGPNFTSEALKIHYGVSETKNIRGSATQEEEKTLEEEGVEFFKIPMPRKIDPKKNN